MPRRKVTREYAERLLAACREASGNIDQIAKLADVGWGTAKGAWFRGLPHGSMPEYHRPFKEIIEEEQEETRARLARQKQAIEEGTVKQELARKSEVKELAIQSATDTREQEGHMIHAARVSVSESLAIIADTLHGARRVSQKAKEVFNMMAQEDYEMTPKDVKEHTIMVSRLTKSLQETSNAGQRIMEMERLWLGEPSKIIATEHRYELSLEEAKVRIDAAQEAMKVIEGTGMRTLDEVPIDPEKH